MLYACGKRYYVCVTCMLWCSNTESVPLLVFNIHDIVWYVLSTYWYLQVCTNIDFLYQSVLGTYSYVPVPNRYILNTLFL
jgi:hypothetical protein